MSFNNVIRSQKGAMFGLDARIALAIFAGLSVIAGAAVFGAIAETKVTALVTELDNFGKGYISHVLDTGADTTTISHMWDSNAVGLAPNWNGPYLTIRTDNHSSYGTYSFIAGRPDLNEIPGTTACTTGELCSIFVRLTDVTNSVAEKVDQKVDTPGTTTATSGNVRLGPISNGVRTLYYKIAGCQTSTCS